ncbi:MAG: gliding motility-associated C-terminal domain-containing protein [Chitinophagales bacterium]|nr:gliding motility-associated C-terminal domain-containing protein [Chitinophagales bacterium]
MRSFCILVFLFHLSLFTFAQCINTFPYTQDFESNNGNWVSGGTGDDWAWGAVSKPVITQAASGSKCWVTGGLTTSFYNLGERSYVQSPCFDFTTVQHPYVSFNIFWETENTYDGATFQYSLNGGTTWQNAGGTSDTTDCLDQNWFNSFSINNLNGIANPQQGWAGNVQNTSGSCQGGGGSNGWKSARHCMQYLAGKPNVVFRFAFGAGTQCNSFDGFAFDDFTTGEAPADPITFSFACSGNNINFSGASNFCLYNYNWNFGDGTTGTGLFTTHTYSSAGSYSVTLSADNKCQVGASTTQQVQMLSVATNVVTDVSCNGGNNGKAVVSPTGGSNYTYSWNSTPVQTTDTAFNLPAGNYLVIINSPGFCELSTTVSIKEPTAISTSFTTTDDTCFTSMGSIAASTTGGTGTYQYLWSNGASTASLTNLSAGIYNLTITDSSNCAASAHATVNSVNTLTLVISSTNISCYGTADGEVLVTASGGKQPYIYNWSNNAITASINRLKAGTYYVTVSDAGNCVNNDSAIITQEVCPSYIYFPTGFSPNADGANDLFKATASPDLKKYSLQIYNRWGEKVFETTDVTEGWDGRYKYLAQPLSTYVWFAEFTFDGQKKQTQSGNVTLVR